MSRDTPGATITVLKNDQILESDYARLEPFRDDHKELLFDSAMEDPEIFHHMFFGPFENRLQFDRYIDSKKEAEDSIAYAVYLKSGKQYVGSASLLNIRKEHGVAEIGSVWYRKTAQGTEANTATVLLLLETLFESHSFRRIEWKCDETNLASRNAAEKMGFVYEGMFRNHMIIKGRNRNTSWFAITDDDWPELKLPLMQRVDTKSADSK